MGLINLLEKQVSYKIVYYGPALGGKTTNLKYIYESLSAETRGEFVTLQTETERTLFFDCHMLDLGLVNGFKIKANLYTVPGQQEFMRSRREILKGVDGLVFVADSDASRIDDNLESWSDMCENLRAHSIDENRIPIVIQYNKRDLNTALPVDGMEIELNKSGYPTFESIAITGQGVYSTFKAITKQVISID